MISFTVQRHVGVQNVDSFFWGGSMTNRRAISMKDSAGRLTDWHQIQTHRFVF